MSRARRRPTADATDDAGPEMPCNMIRYLRPRKSIAPSIGRSPTYDAAGLAEMAILATPDSSAWAPAARIAAARIAIAAAAHRASQPARRNRDLRAIMGAVDSAVADTSPHCYGVEPTSVVARIER